MQRIAILTAGGDTPALNATIHGAVTRASQLRVEALGLIKGFNSLFHTRTPHVHLNPLFMPIPELDPTRGGTILGASRDYVDPNNHAELDKVCSRLKELKVDGVVCIGGDGTMNGLQPLCDRIPTVLAPKTIDNDMGLNYPNEADQWLREPRDEKPGYGYRLAESRNEFDLEQMVNYVTPGYATAVFVAANGVERVRSTAESHRRIGIIEVMGRHSGYIALGAAYGQPDIVLLPEQPLNLDVLVDRIKEIYDLQENVVIVCGEGIVDESGHELGASQKVYDPSGNVMLTGASEALRQMLVEAIGDKFFHSNGRNDSAKSAIFTRKVGHTQRGGRPLQFDRFHAAQLGGKAVEMLLEGQNNAVATLQWNKRDGFYVDSTPGYKFRDRWGQIHARYVHRTFYDAYAMQPSRVGIDYLLNIFTNAIGQDDLEHMRDTMFDSGNLFRRYHSINTDINKRIRYL
jgi:6-phosphofructokinase 1